MKKYLQTPKFTFLKFLILFILIISFSTEGYAIPAFARQTGMSCTACHFQHFPALNSFGRAFKANGYTMVGGKEAENLDNGKSLSLPSTLNASVVGKFRYQKTNGADNSGGTNKGEFQMPDEAALFLGGRVGKNVGFIIEGQMADPTSPFFASFKMPFTFDVKNVKLSVIPFITDGLGASFGFELLNTGSVRNVRVFEHRKEASAQQYLGTDGNATGVAFVAYKNWGFVNYSLWAPVHGTNDAGPFMSYIRVAVTPNVGGWDLGSGVQIWTGKSVYEGGTIEKSVSGWAIDAQAQGAIGTIPIGFYVTYGDIKKSTSGAVNLFNSSIIGDKKAFTINTEVGIIPQKMTIGGGYRMGDTGALANNKQNAILLGVTYQLAQNIQFQLNRSWYSGNYYAIERANGDAITTVQLFTSF